MAFRIWAGEPASEISPLTKTLVSITKRGRNFTSATLISSDRSHRLRNFSLDLGLGDTAVRGLHFRDRLPGIDVLKSPSNDQGLGENSADRSPLFKSFLGHFGVNAGWNANVNLTVE